jgi:hypothetical protein
VAEASQEMRVLFGSGSRTIASTHVVADLDGDGLGNQIFVFEESSNPDGTGLNVAVVSKGQGEVYSSSILVPHNPSRAARRCLKGGGRLAPSVTAIEVDKKTLSSKNPYACRTVLRIDEGLCASTCVSTEGVKSDDDGMRYWYQ